MVGTPSVFDTVLELCADEHRRIVLAVLADQKRTLTLDDLAKTIVKHNHHTPIEEVSGETVLDIKTSLYHLHVPKLAEAGLVDFDSDRHVVNPTGHLEEIEPHLSSILDADPGLEAKPKL